MTVKGNNNKIKAEVNIGNIFVKLRHSHTGQSHYISPSLLFVHPLEGIVQSFQNYLYFATRRIQSKAKHNTHIQTTLILQNSYREKKVCKKVWPQ